MRIFVKIAERKKINNILNSCAKAHLSLRVKVRKLAKIAQSSATHEIKKNKKIAKSITKRKSSLVKGRFF